MDYDFLKLDNGVRIVGERIDHFRSASVGLWVGAGSQYETVSEAGLSHFIEHMVFKGTQRRSAKRIAQEMDAVGGQLNAFTAKECTCFYAKVMDEHLPLAMDVVADMVTAPAFDAGEMEKEKGVVLEEIAMNEDTPEDLVYELLMLAHYGDQPLSRPILGTQNDIETCTPERLRAYWGKQYRPQNVVLSVAGHYDWTQVTELAQKLLGNWSPDNYEARAFHVETVPFGVQAKEKDIEQIHICMGYPGLPIGDEQNFHLSVLNSVLGGAMSSRLFQKIREETGAAYTVYSSPNSYTQTGMLSVYAATNPDMAKTVCGMIREEVALLAEHGLTREEFIMAREQLKASFVLALESTSARMQTLGRRMLLMNETRSHDEVLRRLDAIQLEEVNSLSARLLSEKPSLSLVGNGAEALAEVCL
ncbi:MAG: insulinase family protein [Clostridia bacterium]|nr:insulinase family protein [Clostridia bacterium]